MLATYNWLLTLYAMNNFVMTVHFRWDSAIHDDLVHAAYNTKESEDFLARSKQASENRNTEVEGPETGVSKHSGGSVSFVTTNERLTRASERTLTVNDLYLHLHTKNHDGVTFVDTISARFYAQLERRRQELTQATPDQSVDEMALYYDVDSMVPRSEFDNIANQLRQVVAFMQSQFGMTIDRAGPSQLPPPSPPPLQEQQQHVQMDPADPVQHDDVNRERQDWVVEDA
ncbi:hypothetical protein Sjap_001771 [Stephania japonica]|uniref:Uncharacterized protein n=1 Tax=Stephania japonica TaxID=461633 RepID=A0AAP0KKR2_9MAGN